MQNTKLKEVESTEQTQFDEKRIKSEDLPPDRNFFHTFIIHPDAKWKSIFDVFILVLVLYTCIANMLFITFPI